MALEKFSAIGPRQKVAKVRRIGYSLQQDRWRLSDKPPLRDGGSIKLELPAGINPAQKKGVSDRLTELDKLRSSEKISDQEYQKLRQKILNDL